MTTPHAPAETTTRIAGWTLLLCFLGVSTSDAGFFIPFKPPFTRITDGEANLWLALTFLLTPAGLLLGYAYREPLTRLLEVARRRIAALTRTERAATLVFLGVVVAVASRLANELVLNAYPITDDEWAARFGGQALAQGKFLVEVPFTLTAFPDLFMFVRGHSLTSMDWLGTQLAWMLAELTHSGHWVFALSAAIPAPCVAYVLAKRLSPAWGALGALIVSTSPMAFALSMTTHGHLHSRAFIALTLALYVWGSENWSPKRAALVGFALGTAVICRPFEAVALLGPLVVLELTVALKTSGPRRHAVLVALLTALGPVALFFAHSHAITGGWLPPRFSAGAHGTASPNESLWTRFGSNCAFNLLRLGIWFAGPVGVVLVALGVTRDQLTKVLGLGVVALLLVGLGHENYGIHAVGPIHQSEAVVPLTLIAVHGLQCLTERASALGVERLPIIAAVVTSLLLVHGAFDLTQSLALHGQSEIQAKVYRALEEEIPASARPAVVLLPQFGSLWLGQPSFAARGTWVYEWRRPTPDFSDPVMFLHDAPGALASVRRGLPGRAVFRLGQAGAHDAAGLVRVP